MVLIKAIEGAGIAGTGAVLASVSAGADPTNSKGITSIFIIAAVGAMFKALKNIIDGTNKKVVPPVK